MDIFDITFENFLYEVLRKNVVSIRVFEVAKVILRKRDIGPRDKVFRLGVR